MQTLFFHRARPHSRSRLRFALAGTAVIFCVLVAGCGPKDPLDAIRQQQATGDLQGSIDPLRKLLQGDYRHDPEANYLYGRALALTGQVGLAEWSLREAMKDPKWLAPAGQQLAFVLLGTGNHTVVVEVVDRILATEPDHTGALLMRAQANVFGRIDLDAALVDADRVLELDPTLNRAQEVRILALIGLERIEEAGAALDALGEQIETQQLGADVQGWHCATAAIFANDGGEKELAKERWDDCVERFPTVPNVVRNAAGFYDSLGDIDRSIEIFRTALDDDPASRPYRLGVTERLRAIGRVEEAESELRAATETVPAAQRAVAWMDVVKHHQFMEEHDKAATAAEKVVESARASETMYPQLALEYADAMLLAGRYDEALAATEDMTVAAYRAMIRARVAQERGQFTEALEHYDEAFRLWPNNPWARFHAAMAAESAGQFDRAVEEYRYSIRVDAAATEARTRVAQLHAAEGRFLQASQILQVASNVASLEMEGSLLSVYLLARTGQTQATQHALTRFEIFQDGAYLGRALMLVGRATTERLGPAATTHLLLSVGTALREPGNALALAELIRVGHDSERSGEIEPIVRDAVEQHPEVASVHAVLGLWLELTGDAVKARAAYERALSLDDSDSMALVGMGRLTDDAASALSWFDRALASDPDDADAARGAADVLVAAGKPAEAEARLDALLLEHPFDADAATQIVQLRLDRGALDETTLERARRAARFGGGPAAWDRLARIQTEMGDADGALESSARAEKLRAGSGTPANTPKNGPG